ncbi:hypothetical protein [Meiothermus taiwanensis]|nr:hypothetical protein [Meiothermus taiwanensis]
MVGIWQQTVSSAGDYTNTFTNETFTLTQGFSAQLKIRANGQFSFDFYTQGVASNCSVVSYLERMSGTLEIQQNRLILRPKERRLVVRNCTRPGNFSLPTTPVTMGLTLSWTRTLIKEPTLQLELTGPYTLRLKQLQRDLSARPEQPPQPENFQLGEDLPYQEFIGLWAPSDGSDLNFYNPRTGAYYLPKYNASEHRWLRFFPGGYELATSLENAGPEGACKKDLIYYETGRAAFKILEERNGKYYGDLRLEATDSRLVVRVSKCESDDGVKTYKLQPLTSYYKWEWFGGENSRFTLDCTSYPWHEWQFAVCTNDINSFRRRQ